MPTSKKTSKKTPLAKHARASAQIAFERIPITDVAPVIECGKYPAKAVAGEQVTIGATVFREGHDALGVNVVVHDPFGVAAPFTPMRLIAPGTDRYEATITATVTGLSAFHVEAWGDPLETWRHDARIKIPEGQDVELMLEEGALLHERAAAGVPAAQRALVTSVAAALRSGGDPIDRLSAALAPGVLGLLTRLAREANLRFDDEARSGVGQLRRQCLPCRHRKDCAEMAHRNLFAIDMIMFFVSGFVRA